ncbi:C40 family peptidase [Streptomyces albogriseolus]|uniref:C40 family peptidase n=1 Tax=Streptomyces albogriseolus TaxID=1887 RepID=UPI00224F8318|nr:NlpC/P60 family protein [Streptomyces viridodiastaticus]MCX4569156.1 NlpC/P60 family protein [Streptomyces viridodiastaticus]
MSGMLLRLVCTAALAAGTVLAPLPAAAVPEPGGAAAATGDRSVPELLTDLQTLYREAEKATERYNATEEALAEQRAETERLEKALARTRLSLHDSRGAAGRLARQQYQSLSGLSPYVRLLLARDPQRALEQGHVIGQLARERAQTVGRLTGDARQADELARRAREALDERIALTERRGKERDQVVERLRDVEELLASLTADQLAELAELERGRVDEAQRALVASGALSGANAPSAAGERAVRYAVEQLGKPYEWGAEGPETYDCSGLTSEAWRAAGAEVPRTSQEQWARLERIDLVDLRPGDLVVYFHDATHVALYLGDGMVVQAPRPGARIKVSPVAANPVLGAVRPDPGGEPLEHYVPPELPEGATDGSDEGYGAVYAPAAPETSAR